MCALNRGSPRPPSSIPLPLPLAPRRHCPTSPHSDQASPFRSCCPIVCRHGERHRLPHHAGERPGAGGRGGGLSPAVGGAQPDPDLLLGIGEGRHPPAWHRGEGQPGTAPTTQLLGSSAPLGAFTLPRDKHGESLPLPPSCHRPSSSPAREDTTTTLSQSSHLPACPYVAQLAPRH